MNTRATCFVCGHKTLDERCDWDICPICLWEDDVLVIEGKDISSPANRGMMVSQAQANFMKFGASSEKGKRYVRKAELKEPLDPNWKPLAKAIILAEQS